MLTVLIAWMGLAFGGTLAGVTVPDTATLGGETVQLNGLGLREKFFFDIYVGSLYLKTKTSDAKKAIEADEPKMVEMHFIYDELTKEQVAGAFEESFAKNPGAAAVRSDLDKLISWVPAKLKKNQVIVFEYVPGTGTTFKVDGTAKGTVAGADFMKVVWGIWLGPNPPTAALKTGMLGK